MNPDHPNQQNGGGAENESSSYLMRREVVRRRLNSSRSLSRLYRDGYWHLMGQLRNEHRQYISQTRRSPFQTTDNIGVVDCAFDGCQSKAMPLTTFCFLHILSDPRQVLYKPCQFLISSSQAGPITCRKPILSSMVPAYCDVHMQLSRMHLTSALQGQGLNISSSSQVKPQLHLLIPELVRQIQAKRRKECKCVVKKEDDDIAES